MERKVEDKKNEDESKFKLIDKYQNTRIGKGLKNINYTDQATS